VGTASEPTPMVQGELIPFRQNWLQQKRREGVCDMAAVQQHNWLSAYSNSLSPIWARFIMCVLSRWTFGIIMAFLDGDCGPHCPPPRGLSAANSLSIVIHPITP
jgi:hypothetical protein